MAASTQTAAGRVVQYIKAAAKGNDKEGMTSVGDQIDKYNKMHDHYGGDATERKKEYADLVNSYYNLATDFYEIGWGQSFHFANRLAGESHDSSIVRHEYYLASRLGIQPTDTVLDCGCGIGGPLRNLGRFTGASITGVTLNQYQVNRGNQLCAEAQLAPRCKLVQADFHKLPFPDNSFDHCYSIEACCHSPDRADVYREILRVLKPGGMFVSYEWCLTKVHDPANEKHVRSKRLIEEGDGLPDLMPTGHCDESLAKAGFEFLEGRDAALDPNPSGVPWFTILTPSFVDIFRLQFTWIGTLLVNLFLNFLETIRLAPKGSGKVREMLRQAQLGLVMGGQMGTFTPMYYVHAKKPVN